MTSKHVNGRSKTCSMNAGSMVNTRRKKLTKTQLLLKVDSVQCSLDAIVLEISLLTDSTRYEFYFYIFT